MDAPRELTPEQADAALRDLFRQAGSLQAPDSFDARVLERLDARPPVGAAPLMPRWAWGLAALLCAALIIVPFTPRSPGLSAVFRPWHLELPAWSPMAMFCGALLLALHFWLERRATATS